MTKYQEFQRMKNHQNTKTKRNEDWYQSETSPPKRYNLYGIDKSVTIINKTRNARRGKERHSRKLIKFRSLCYQSGFHNDPTHIRAKPTITCRITMIYPRMIKAAFWKVELSASLDHDAQNHPAGKERNPNETEQTLFMRYSLTKRKYSSKKAKRLKTNKKQTKGKQRKKENRNNSNESLQRENDSLKTGRSPKPSITNELKATNKQAFNEYPLNHWHIELI